MVNTQTQRQAKLLVAHCKLTGPVISTWDKVGVNAGIPWGIYSIVANVRDHPDIHGGTFRFIELGPRQKIIGFAHRQMSKADARILRVGGIVQGLQERRRHHTNALADEIIDDVLDTAEQSVFTNEMLVTFERFMNRYGE